MKWGLIAAFAILAGGAGCAGCVGNITGSDDTRDPKDVPPGDPPGDLYGPSSPRRTARLFSYGPVTMSTTS